ncbi:MAG: PQQ-binding-like beta-propeller repeat protein [Patescibacteria group bacterium]|jgi:hypothetical protein
MKTKLIFAVWLAIVSLAAVSCYPEIEITIPKVTIIDYADITDTSVIVRGKIISDGGSPVTEIKAIVQPGNLAFTSSQTISQGEFVIEINNLEPSTEYQVSVYATNIAGSSLSEVASITTADKPSDPNDPVDPNANAFRIPGVYMMEVAVDNEGSVYATGGYSGPGGLSDGVIVKFSSEGKLLWRHDITGDGGDSYASNLVIDNNRGVVLAYSTRNGRFDIGDGDLYLDSYNLNDGSLNWSKLQGGAVSRSMLDSEGNLISSRGNSGIFKISPQGEVMERYTGQYSGWVDLFGDYLIASLDFRRDGQRVVGVAKFSGFFQEKIWEFSGPAMDMGVTAMGVVGLAKDSLIIVTSMTTIPLNEPGWAYRAYVTAYRERADKTLSLVWEYEYIATSAIVITIEDNLLVCPVGGESYMQIIDQQGMVIWEYNDGQGVRQAAYHDGIIYFTDEKGNLRFISAQ